MVFRTLRNLDESYSLAKSIYAGFGNTQRLLVREGVPLSDVVKSRLHEFGYDYLYVNDRHSASIVADEMISQPVVNMALMSIERFYVKVAAAIQLQELGTLNVDKKIASKRQIINSISTNELNLSIKQIIEDLNAGDVHRYGSTLQMPGIYGLPAHVLRTTILSLILARSLGRNKYELETLGLSSLLHDIGVMLLGFPTDNLQAIKAQGDDGTWRKHPIIGKLILDQFDLISTGVKSIVLEHHEYQDGSGYPLNLRMGDESLGTQRVGQWDDRCALVAILTVANDFDAFAWREGGEKGDSRSLALMKLKAGKNSKYISEIVDVAEKVIVPYPVASLVKIEKCANQEYVGALAVVEKTDSKDFTKYQVQTIPSQGRANNQESIFINLEQGESLQRIF